MSDEPIQVRQVRWMGMGFGIVVAALGLLVCAGAVSFGSEAAEKGSPGLWAGTAVTLLVGGLAVRYGISLFRRSRNDDDILTLTSDNGLNLRGYWWRRPPGDRK